MLKILIGTLFLCTAPITNTPVTGKGEVRLGFAGNISYGVKGEKIDQMIEDAQRIWHRQCKIRHRCF